MRKQKTEEERAKALERMTESIRQLQAREGPYYDKWHTRYNAWRESRAKEVKCKSKQSSAS